MVNTVRINNDMNMRMLRLSVSWFCFAFSSWFRLSASPWSSAPNMKGKTVEIISTMSFKSMMLVFTWCLTRNLFPVKCLWQSWRRLLAWSCCGPGCTPESCVSTETVGRSQPREICCCFTLHVCAFISSVPLFWRMQTQTRIRRTYEAAILKLPLSHVTQIINIVQQKP